MSNDYTSVLAAATARWCESDVRHGGIITLRPRSPLIVMSSTPKVHMARGGPRRIISPDGKDIRTDEEVNNEGRPRRPLIENDPEPQLEIITGETADQRNERLIREFEQSGALTGATTGAILGW